MDGSSVFNSRAIFAIGVFLLSCLILTGSLALHLASAEAAVEKGERGEAFSRQNEPRSFAELDEAEGLPSHDVPAGLENPIVSATTDTLRFLLERVHFQFGTYGADVEESMIPDLARIIAVVNQHAEFSYRFEIFEANVILAQQRAETLNDMLRLNVLNPSSVSIVAREGSHSVRVHVEP